MERITLSSEDWRALNAALANPPEPTDKLRAIMRASYQRTVNEGVPDWAEQLLAKLK